MTNSSSPPGTDGSPLRVHGKFFLEGERKLHLRGVTYGPVAMGSHGFPFPEESQVEQDFRLMAELGANCLRTFTVPPRWLLDRAAQAGLRVLVTVPWAQHLCFLDSREEVERTRAAIRAAALECGGHPGLLGFLVGNEISPDVVRWHGPRRVARFLSSLRDLVKEHAPGALVGYANFPSTEYLDVSDAVDFLAFNVYLHRPQDLRRYVSRLQNLADDKPLVLTELGADSLREGREGQAALLSSMLRTAFECGAAGTFAFAWTDDWFAYSGGGFQVEDWAFGLVDRQRQKKPAFHAVQQLYHAPALPPLASTPRVSVVVCAYNAERTMDDCLESLRTLSYPDYEVVVVNDGSRDRTGDISEQHQARYRADPHAPRFVLIHQPNRGLSVARNVGREAATGDVIAYTDSDCVADPDWLTLLVSKMQQGGYSAVGGPNFPPREDTLVPSAVAVAPGGPNHVLLDDELAEHIPGCNMAFRRQALEEIHGFDPVYTAAGDDVDVCWRLQERGHVIGFSAGATVWHYRRHTVKAYLNQQRGYGKAEALLYFKHPERFNEAGQSRWGGRVYSRLRSGTLFARPLIYFGRLGRGPFQLLYARPDSLLAHVPFSLEWNVGGLVLLALAALLLPVALPLAALPLLLSAALALRSGLQARIDPRFAGPRAVALVALLTWAGPLARAWERAARRLRGPVGRPVAPAEEQDGAPTARVRTEWLRRAFTLAYWGERGGEKEGLLGGTCEALRERGLVPLLDTGWRPWDLEVQGGAWVKARLGTAVEYHGGDTRLFRLRCALRLTRPALLALLACGLAALGGWGVAGPWGGLVGLGLGLVVLVAIAREAVHLGRAVSASVQSASRRLALSPLEPVPTPAPGFRARWRLSA